MSPERPPEPSPSLDPLELVPHRPPFLLLDRLVAWDAVRAVGELLVRAGLPLSPAGTLPPYLLAEALAQTAAAHAGALGRAAHSGTAPPHRGVVVRLDGFEVERPPREGETVRLEVELDKVFGALRRYRAFARVGDEGLARGTFTFATDPVP